MDGCPLDLLSQCNSPPKTHISPFQLVQPKPCFKVHSSRFWRWSNLPKQVSQYPSRPMVFSGARANAIAATRAAIQNEPRTIHIRNKDVPFYLGPVNRDGSLAQQIALSEVQVLIANSTNYGALFSSAISEQLSAGKLTSLDAISGIYDAVPKGLFRPMSTDISDATFGQERITTKAMKLHQVRPNEYRSSRAFALTDAQLSKLCGRGATWNNIRRQKQLYVEDYHDIAQWNDPEAPEKYVPTSRDFSVTTQCRASLYRSRFSIPTQASHTRRSTKRMSGRWPKLVSTRPPFPFTSGCTTLRPTAHTHLKEFPSTFTAKAQLQRLLTHLIYLSGVKHHAMNSAVIWSAISAPYSTGALHKALPARKGVPVNLMDFVAPPVTLPVILGDLSAFMRPVAPVHSWLGAYAVAPFSQEAALQPAIADLQMSLRTIDLHPEAGAWPEVAIRVPAPFDAAILFVDLSRFAY